MGLTTAMAALPSLLITLLTALVMTGISAAYARRRGLIDQPGRRSSHQQATPRGGGAGIVIAIVVGSVLLGAKGLLPDYWLSAGLPPLLAVAVIGGWDDHNPVFAWLRIFVHCAAAFYLLIHIPSSLVSMAGPWVDPGQCASLGMGFGMGFHWALAVYFIAALTFVVWMTNIYNFMDGSNGMAGAQGVFVGLLLAALMWQAGDAQAAMIPLMITVACGGFLPWNLGNARVFMGDVGSTSLGFTFAAVILYGHSRCLFDLPVALLVILVFAVDTGCTLVVRVFRGERWYNAHKQHVYQQLIMHGWPHGRVLLLYQTINVLLVTPGVVLAINYPALAWFIFLTTALILGMAWYLTIRRIGAFA